VNAQLPMRKVRLRSGNFVPLTANLRMCIGNRRRLYKAAFLSQSELIWKRYRVYNNVLNKALKRYHNNSFRESIDKAKDSKTKWKIFNTVLRCRRKAPDTDISVGASLFADEFKNLVEDAVNKSANVDETKFLEYLSPQDTQFCFRQVSGDDVLKSIGNLSPNSTNFDRIPARAFLDCSVPIADVMAKLINVSLTQGSYPTCLKLSKIVPVFKKGDIKVPSNYRPGALISIFAKVFERVVYDMVNTYFERNNLFSNTQYGFRPGRSTVLACADLVDHIHKLVDERYTVSVVFLDITKAFDTVNHKLLLRKLSYYGFGSTVLKWFSSYLAGRAAFVQVGDQTAVYSGPEVGVPQGSVLGPLLYNVFVNDLDNAAYQCRVTQYADDTCLLVKSRKCAEHLREKIERALANVLDWFGNNKLCINPDKSQFILFGRLRKEICSIQVGARKVAPIPSIIYLGLRIDSGLSWHDHIQHVISRVKQFRLMIRKLRGALTVSIRIYLTKVLILPIINLYNFIYCTGYATDLHHLDVAYNDLMRTILGYRRSEHIPISRLHTLTSLKSLVEYRNYSLLSFIAKIANNDVFSMMWSDCIRVRSTYAFRTQNRFVIPKYHTSFGMRRVCVRGLKLLNECSTKC
jgi:hypothetical protein